MFLFRRGAQQAFKPADTQERQTTDTAMVGRATVNVNVLSLFHMKQLRSPASYRRGRWALFLPTVPVPPPKTLFSASARLCTGFRLFYCNTAHRPFNYLCRTIVAWSIEIGGWQADRLSSLSGNARSRVTSQSREITRLHGLGYDDYLSPVPSLFFYG